MYQYFVTEQEKIRAKEIQSKVFSEPISLDDMRLFIRYLKHDIELNEIELIKLDKEIARDKFDLLNYNNYSFFSFISKGAMALSIGAKNMCVETIESYILSTRNLIKQCEKMLHEWENDPESKKRYDEVFEIQKQIMKIAGDNFNERYSNKK